MGDEYSDWEGVKHTFTAGSDIASGMDNKIKLSENFVSESAKSLISLISSTQLSAQ